MVRTAAVTSFGRSGLSDWLIQRVTAVILAGYTLFIIGTLACSGGVTYEQWSELHNCLVMQVANTLVLLSIVVHAWIGLWSVLTDYVTDRIFQLKLGLNLGSKATGLRLLATVAAIILLFAYTVWGLAIIWGA